MTRYEYKDNPPGDSLTWPRFSVSVLWDYRGTPVFGLFTDGAQYKAYQPATGQTSCPAIGLPTRTRCVQLQWPFAGTAYDKTRGLITTGWHGSLLAVQRDGSGLEYMRNRMYDPKTGRFTQEDPIGLAGGLNLYGYANGDPVNFSDPFGLKVTPVGAEAARVIAELRRASPTFRRIYDALDAADPSKVNIAFRLGSNDLVYALSRGASYTGVFERGNPRRPGAQIVVASTSPEVLGHEFAHAAGSFAPQVYRQTGVPGVCATDQSFSLDARCGAVQSDVYNEASKDQRKKKP